MGRNLATHSSTRVVVMSFRLKARLSRKCQEEIAKNRVIREADIIIPINEMSGTNVAIICWIGKAYR
jgi:hypothetical protein